MVVRHVLVGMFVLVAAVAVSGFDQTATQPQTELSAREAVQVMRWLNTAQAAIARAQAGQYGTLAAVLQQDPGLQPQVTGVTETRGTLRGYTLTLAIADGGRRYQAALTPERACGLALFTNEGGLIYRGWVLDCPTQ